MAKRKFSEILFAQNQANGYLPGDDAAHRAAAAMGDRFDAPTLAAVGDALSYLERIGGQVHIVTLREKFNNSGQRVEESELGEWETAALLIEYETRDARVVIARPPEQVYDIPVTEFSEPATERDLNGAAEAEEIPPAEVTASAFEDAADDKQPDLAPVALTD